MAPTLEAGDWLLVDPDAYRVRGPMPDDLVLVSDPREPERLLVKRLAGFDGAGDLLVAGDTPEASTDSRSFGALDPATVQGRPWFRYRPLRRWGRVS